MVVKKFFGKTTRDALRQVRDELGTDALILSNRSVPGGGIEIMAVADADVNTLAASLATNVKHPPRHGGSAAALPPKSAKPSPVASALARTYALPVEPLAEPVARIIPPNEPDTSIQRVDFSRLIARAEEAANREEPARAEPAPRPEPAPAAEAAPRDKAPAEAAPTTVRAEAKLDELGDEMRELKALLTAQLASLAWANLEEYHPRQAELFRQLLAVGMSPALCRQLVAKLPAHFDEAAALKWAKSALAHNLRVLPEEEDIIDKGGVYALVGPTGVGKTTTVAKLAARATIKHGPESIALISTDSYRIGAQDQLKLYGRILGVSVYAVDNEADLHLTLADLAHKKLVLIDSVGMGQRDNRVSEQTRMYAAGKRPVRRILLLSANAAGHTLQDVITRYQGEGLAGCILSKVDEAPTLGVGLDVAIRHRLPVLYVTNGQRVPEDLYLSDANYLVERTFQPLKQPRGPFSYEPDEYRILQAAQWGQTA